MITLDEAIEILSRPKTMKGTPQDIYAERWNGPMIDFLLTCAAVDAFLLGIVTVAGIVVTLALIIRYWRN